MQGMCDICGRPSGASQYCRDCELRLKGLNAESVPERQNRHESSLAVVAIVLAIAGVLAPILMGYIIVPAALVCSILALRDRPTSTAKWAMGLSIFSAAVITAFSLYFGSRGGWALLQLMSSQGGETAQILGTKSSRLFDVGEANTVTLSHYNQVLNGMSRSQVEAIVGRPGQNLSSTAIGGSTYELWQWANKDGTNMVIGFNDGRVESKSQFGLR